MTEQYPLAVGAVLKIQPEHSARDYSYIVLDPISGGRVAPFKVAVFDIPNDGFIKLVDTHHLLKFQSISDPWATEDILTRIGQSREKGLLTQEDAKTAVAWLHEGISRPQRTFSRSESILITSRMPQSS